MKVRIVPLLTDVPQNSIRLDLGLAIAPWLSRTAEKRLLLLGNIMPEIDKDKLHTT